MGYSVEPLLWYLKTKPSYFPYYVQVKLLPFCLVTFFKLAEMYCSLHKILTVLLPFTFNSPFPSHVYATHPHDPLLSTPLYSAPCCCRPTEVGAECSRRGGVGTDICGSLAVSLWAPLPWSYCSQRCR